MARIVINFESGDSGASVSGEIVETIAEGDYGDVLVEHSDDAEFWCSEICCQAEEGVRVEVLDEMRAATRFVLRLHNDGSGGAYPYYLAPYGGATEVRVTFVRRGFLSP